MQSWKGCVGAIPPGVRIPSSLNKIRIDFSIRILLLEKFGHLKNPQSEALSGSSASRAKAEAVGETVKWSARQMSRRESRLTRGAARQSPPLCFLLFYLELGMRTPDKAIALCREFGTSEPKPKPF